MDVNTIIKEGTRALSKRSLTPHDRCDSCGAQALVQVGLFESDLLFCKHHYEKNEAALAGVGIKVLADDRDVLAREEGSSHAIKE